MNKDDSLLKLEKKLEEHDEREIILNKFKIKPNMKIDKLTKLKKEGLIDFLNKFKQSNEEMDKNNDKNIYNIEINENDENIDEEYGSDKNNKNNINPKIELDLMMGILEVQKKINVEPKDIININEDNIDKQTNEIINFIQTKKKKSNKKKEKKRNKYNIFNNLKYIYINNFNLCKKIIYE